MLLMKPKKLNAKSMNHCIIEIGNKQNVIIQFKLILIIVGNIFDDLSIQRPISSSLKSDLVESQLVKIDDGQKKGIKESNNKFAIN
ncbi:hypothetical protein BpHYR1_001839 [Brachionus plicatilis]|uniref:Uncharacterized protein n=1 Tax=Brachionus plicatilis TaxID=10195 RepID=A0A3M7QUS5_BRAPC|nr:hypothetical protein BpHYR1_001839 [Brachionus plicatilis]